MRACWLKWVGRDWSISADYIWLNYSGANTGVQPASQAAAAALSRLARCAGKRSRVYSAPRPDGFEPMKGRQKRRPTEVDRLNNLWVGRQGFEPWTLGLKVPCSAS